MPLANDTLRDAAIALDPVASLQRKLYRAAKQSRSRRFHALFDKVQRRDFLWRAWMEVARNGGAPGVDGVTIEAIEQGGVAGFLDELSAELAEGRYHPLPLRRVSIPKRTGGERQLGVPAVRDRVCQAAAKLVLEPIFEADFAPVSFGFRPKRSAHQAKERIRDGMRRGCRWVVDADIRGFFDALDHCLLLAMLRERVSDRRVLDLIAGCATKERADAALAVLRSLLAELGLELAVAKTRIVELRTGEEGFDFLGYHYRIMPTRRNRSRTYAACWPSKASVAAAKERARSLVPYSRIGRPTIMVVADLNAFLRGWGAYYRRGNSTLQFKVLDSFVFERLARFEARKRGSRNWRRGTFELLKSETTLGLVRLAGTVNYPAAHAAR